MTGSAERVAIDESKIVNRIDADLSTEDKVKALQALSVESENIIKPFLRQIDAKYGTQSNDDFKLADRIKSKAERPSIREKKPWFDVEHIRDSYRFKTVLGDITVLPKIAKDIVDAGFEVIKIDTEKTLEPAAWGWRIVVLDLKLPNGQLVEYYLPVREVEEAKSAGNHALFEKWRDREPEELTSAEIDELRKDRNLSFDVYEEAWEAYLNRTRQNEVGVGRILAEVRAIMGTG
jgi:hypothetical protein